MRHFPICLNLSEFSNEKNRVDRRVQYHKERSRKTLVENMTSYLNWITQAGLLNIMIFCTFCKSALLLPASDYALAMSMHCEKRSISLLLSVGCGVWAV